VLGGLCGEVFEQKRNLKDIGLHMPKGTFIHGIGASEHLDSSGERISIKGLDISSLERGEGVLNYEHKNENASHIVGKVVKAKKIFSEEDCSNPHELYFWRKSNAPLLYVVGELFDGVGHQQAKEIAAMLKYDTLKRAEDKKNKSTINFSVEGAKLEKQGAEITRAIARKISVTIVPCNKAAVAEELVAQPAQATQTLKNPLDGMFKYEEAQEVQVLEKYEELEKTWKPSVTNMKSGKQVVSFHHPEHGIVTVHEDGGKFHVKHGGAYAGLKGVKGTFGTSQEAMAHAKAYTQAVSSKQVNPKQMHNFSSGSASGAPKLSTPKPAAPKLAASEKKISKNLGAVPSTLVGTSALAKEKIAKMKKSIEENFSTWPNAAMLVKFVEQKRPDLSKAETIALAKMLAWKQAQSAEQVLKSLTASECEPTHEGNKVEELKKPYVSEAQRRWAHTPKGKKALGGKKAVEHWDKESKGKKLPEKVSKSEGPKPYGHTSDGKPFHLKADHPAHKDFSSKHHEEAATKIANDMSDLEDADTGLSNFNARNLHKYWKGHKDAAKAKSMAKSEKPAESSSSEMKYGTTKPHKTHEEYSKLGPSKHSEWAKQHETHSQNAGKEMHAARRAKDKEKYKAAEDLWQKHHTASRMHVMYADAHRGKDQKYRSQALERAKQYHKELGE
jgi:hypothetical protein